MKQIKDGKRTQDAANNLINKAQSMRSFKEASGQAASLGLKAQGSLGGEGSATNRQRKMGLITT